MSADQVRQQATRVLLARCCDHPAFVVACECAEQVAADVEALIGSGLLRDEESPATACVGWEDLQAPVAAMRRALWDGPSRPPVVVLCGSTRSPTEMAQAAKEETIAGRIVIRPECDLQSPDRLWPAQRIEQVKHRLDALHRAKIHLADEVLIVAPGGYLGDSTSAEIACATELGRPIRYWPDRYWPEVPQ